MVFTVDINSMFFMQSAKVNITKKNIDKIMVAIKKRISMRLMLQNEINKTTGSLEGIYCLIWCDSFVNPTVKQIIKEPTLNHKIQIYSQLLSTRRWYASRSYLERKH